MNLLREYWYVYLILVVITSEIVFFYMSIKNKINGTFGKEPQMIDIITAKITTLIIVGVIYGFLFVLADIFMINVKGTLISIGIILGFTILIYTNYYLYKFIRRVMR